MEDADRARAGALPQARPAAAGRADQPPRHSRSHMARVLPRQLGAHRPHRVARPRLPQQDHDRHHVHPRQAAALLRRQLRHIPARARGEPGPLVGDGEAERAARRAPQGIHRALWPRRQEPRQAGAVADEDPATHSGRAVRGRLRRPVPPPPVPVRLAAAAALHHRRQRRVWLPARRRLDPKDALPELRLWRRLREPRRHRRPKRCRQVHLPQAPHRRDRADRGACGAARQAGGRQVHAAPHRDDGPREELGQPHALAHAGGCLGRGGAKVSRPLRPLRRPRAQPNQVPLGRPKVAPRVCRAGLALAAHPAARRADQPPRP
mmetsp:Transcript_49763/g.160922  ORF Transcript_49763/g.160922 Transcript_49763/m.160922 type:complete len:321 (+) Transcript_49763:996-1958(+)